MDIYKVYFEEKPKEELAQKTEEKKTEEKD